MANLTQVLPGDRLFGRPTFEETYDYETILVSLNDNQGTVDAEIFAAGVIVSDTETMTDLLTKLVQKTLSETQASSDAKVLAVAKALTEALGSSDDVVIATTKAFDDPLVLSEDVAKAVEKSFAETQGSSDAKVLSVAKALTESLGTSESRAMAVAKVAIDVVLLAEAVAKAVSKSFAETQGSSDTTANHPQKALNEEIASTDLLLPFLVNKGITDFIILQEWVSIKLIRANVWRVQSTLPVTQTLFGRPLYGQKLFGATPGTTWTKDNARRRNWTNLDGENNQEA